MGRQKQGCRKALAQFEWRLTNAFLLEGKYIQPALVDGEFIYLQSTVIMFLLKYDIITTIITTTTTLFYIKFHCIFK